jgi:RNA polymerase sigma-70 factor (ECF subfamily)
VREPDDAEISTPNGAAAHFAQLLQESQEQLFAYIHSLVRDFNDTDDVFQKSALILWRKFDTYDGSRSFLGWAMGIARFEVSNFLRTRSRSKLYFSDDLNLLLIEAQELMAQDETEARKAALGKCVQKLRERDRALLEEFYGRDERVNDLADRIGRSSHSVHNSLRRIRRSLFECIRRTIRLGDTGGEAMA